MHHTHRYDFWICEMLEYPLSCRSCIFGIDNQVEFRFAQDGHRMITDISSAIVSQIITLGVCNLGAYTRIFFGILLAVFL
jgi:hypothetical protein